jgi:cyclic pyranopterin phosphate synthase
MSDDLTHTDSEGRAQMVDVGSKADSKPKAVTRGQISLKSSTVTAIRDNTVEKADMLATVRVGAVQGVKHTWETIPMCHQIPLTNIDTDFS